MLPQTRKHSSTASKSKDSLLRSIVRTLGCPMRRLGIHILAVAAIVSLTGALFPAPLRVSAQSADHQPASKTASVIFHSTRSSPLDLEVGGELAGQAPSATLYV